MNDLIIEFFSEEMPASLIKNSAENLKDVLKKELLKQNYFFSNDECFYSPTRILIIIEGLKLDIDNSSDEIRGPKANAPIKALEGFAKSMNTKLNLLVKKKTNKGEYYFFLKTKGVNDINQSLSDIMEKVFSKFIWKKSMRWGDKTLRWVRPLKNIICLYNGKVIPFSLKEIKANNLFLFKENLIEKMIKIKTKKEYFQSLKLINVEINHKKRREIIIREGRKLACKAKLNFSPDSELLEEVINLVERPYPLLAKFNKDFLYLPKEILITTMQKHQKYFPLTDNNYVLTNTFLLISNIFPKDRGKSIIEGNQRVINARLSDATFFFEKDLKLNFTVTNENLKKLIFHNQLGTVYQKLARLKKVAIYLGAILNLSNKDIKNLENSVELCKNDLLTEVVKEFPNLQGIMGYYYAKNAKLNDVIARAILQHYKPQGPNNNIPDNLISQLLALLDKLDSLVGFFIIKKQPTSSKDPFALRRASLGIIRIILDGKLHLNLGDLIYHTIVAYETTVNIKSEIQLLKKQISKFILERYHNYLKENTNINITLLNSFYIDVEKLNLFDINFLIIKLNDFFTYKKGISVLKSLKRVYNIVDDIEENKNLDHKVKVSLFKSQEEKMLYKNINDFDIKFSSKDLVKNINLVFSLLYKLCKPIDKFFDNIKINDNDKVIRENRLSLLVALKRKTDQLINFSILIKGMDV